MSYDHNNINQTIQFYHNINGHNYFENNLNYITNDKYFCIVVIFLLLSQKTKNSGAYIQNTGYLQK